VIIAWTRTVEGCRADHTSRAGRTYWSGRTSRAGRTCLVLLDDSFLSPNAYLHVKIPTQLVKLY
jgi:hypothetical protein